jgi:2-pyrone-4,6-dicarboxylate lactonase
VFRFADDRPYTPQDAPKEDLFRLHKRLGFERGVFVQSTTHGKDHSVVTDLSRRRRAVIAESG